MCIFAVELCNPLNEAFSDSQFARILVDFQTAEFGSLVEDLDEFLWQILARRPDFREPIAQRFRELQIIDLKK